MIKLIPFIFLLFCACSTEKQVYIIIKNSDNVKITVSVQGSDVEDLKPSIDFPLFP